MLNTQTRARADADRLPHSHQAGTWDPAAGRHHMTAHLDSWQPPRRHPSWEGDDRRGPKRSGYRSERPGCGFESRPVHPPDGPV